MLVDTGSNKSFIDPKYLHPSRIKYIQPINVKTLFQTHQVTGQISINGLMEFKTREPLEFLSFKFHNYFDGLIGLEMLQKLKVKLDLHKGLLQTDKVTIPLLFKPNYISKLYTIPPRNKITIQIPVDIEQGEIYIKPVQVQSQLIIPEGIYNADKWYSLVEIINFSTQIKQCVFEQPIKVESLENYSTELRHTSTILSDRDNYQNILQLIRT